MRRFHEWDLTWWTEQGLSEFLVSNASGMAEVARQEIPGWPYERLSPRRLRERGSIRVGLATGLAVGWWLHAILFVWTQAARIPAAAVPPKVIAAMLAIPTLARSMPPSLGEWRLTGHHQYCPVAQPQSQELTQTS